jgi:hypothetical protein
MLTRIATSLLALAAGSIAHDAMAADFRQVSGLKPTSDAVLGDMRGGFITAGGLTLDIGITTSTYINGQLALRTSVGTGPTGPTSPSSPTAPTSPTAPGGGQPSGGGVSSNVSNNSSGPAPTPQITTTVAGGGSGPTTVTGPTGPTGPTGGSGSQGSSPIVQGALAPNSTLSGGGSSVTGASGGSGTVTTTTNDGQTTVVQNPSQGINALANSANNQNIVLDTQVNLVLPGFDAVQRQGLLSSMGMKMGADGSFGIVSSLPH